MRKVNGLRWWMISLVMMAGILNFLSRSTVAVAAPVFLHDLNISEKQFSWIMGVFQAALAMQPLCGYALDVIGLKIGFAVFVTIWSIANMSHGLAHSWQFMAGLRGIMGFCEGSATPGGVKATAEWFPATERGTAGGVFNLGASFGAVLAPPIVTWAILHYSWQTAFIIVGVLGLAYVALWLKFYDSPALHRDLSDNERAYILAGQEKSLGASVAKPSFAQIVRQRNFWGIALPRFLADPFWGMLSIWMPLYLTSVRHLQLREIALYAWLPFLGADLGSMFAGFLTSRLQRNGVGLITARRIAFTVGACLMTGMGFVGFVQSPYAAIALFALGGFAHQTLSVTVITMSSDLFRRSEVATVASMGGIFGTAGMLLFSLLIGALVAGVGYGPFFVALGMLDLVGAGILWGLVRTPNGETG